MLTPYRRSLAAIGGFLRCGKRRVVAAEAVGGVPGMPGLAGGSGGEGVGGSAGVVGLAGVREWRGCGRGAFIDRSKLLLLL